MILSLHIAKRYLISKKSSNAVNIISWISLIAVAIGTCALVIILSGMNGLTNLVEDLYNSFDTDIEITAKEGKVFAADSLILSQIKSINGIEYVSQSVEDNVLLKYDNKQMLSTIKGVGKDFVKMTSFDTLIEEGLYATKGEQSNYMVLGKGVAGKLQINLNDKFSSITVYSPKRGKVSSLNPDDHFNEARIRPIGIFSINDEFDFKYSIIDIDLARELFDYTNEVSSIEIGLSKGANSDEVQNKLSKVLGTKYFIKNRFQQNALLFKTLESEKLWTTIILLFILIIATFNSIGAFTILILEKKKDILILKNLGANQSLINQIFFIEGLLITMVGAVLGIAIGLLVCWLQMTFGWVEFSSGYAAKAYPIDIRMLDILIIFGTVFIIGSLSALYSIRVFARSSKYNDSNA